MQPWPDSFWRAAWVNAQTLEVDDRDRHIYHVDTTTGAAALTASATPSATPVLDPIALSADADTRFSPDGRYVFICDTPQAGLYRLSDAALLAALETESWEDCYTALWSPDSRAVAFAQPGVGLNIMRTDGQVIAKLLPNIMGAFPLWSPDSSRLMVFEKLPGGDRAAFYVAYPDHRPLLALGYEIANIHWEPGGGTYFYSETLFWNFQGCGYLCGLTELIDTDTGATVAYWGASFAPVQWPVASLDRRWLATDSTNEPNEQPGHRYELFDLEGRQRWEVYAGAAASLQLVGWETAGGVFYAVSVPVTSTSSAPAELPFGLLKLDSSDQSITLVDAAVVLAALSPNGEVLWLVNATASGGLELAQMTVASGAVSARVPLAGGAVIWDPAETPLLPSIWSPNGRDWLYQDAAGAVWLARANGTVAQLADMAPPLRAQTGEAQVAWSPDETQLLYHSEKEAWIVTLPE